MRPTDAHVGPLRRAAMQYLDDLVARRSARLTITPEEGGLWRAHIAWNDGHPVHPIIGYSGYGTDRDEAVYRLAETIRDDRNGRT